MRRIKFGTDGWRGVIGRDFTVENVARLSLACTTWLLRKHREATVVIGYDSRFGGPMFAEVVAKIMGSKGIKVILSDRFTATPVVSYVVHMMKAEMGVMITASHNPHDYNGFKVKGTAGGPLFEEDVKDIENLIDYENEIELDLIKIESLLKKEILTIGNIEDYYIQNIREHFNLPLLLKDVGAFALDPMYGSGQNIFARILPGIKLIHNIHDYGFNGTPPEPLEKNLGAFINLMKNDSGLKIGVALDGDADRLALIDEAGNYIDSHTIILLLIYILAGYKKEKGIIVTGFSSTARIEKLAAYYLLPVERVKIGFKEISRKMVSDTVLLGGEESGGIGVKGYIPERDGIWNALLIWEFIVETGKSLKVLVEELKELTGDFYVQREDLKVDKDKKSRILEKCNKHLYSYFGDLQILRTEQLDGYKYYFEDDLWVLIRASGTEPVLRIYAEGKTKETAETILKQTIQTILED